MSKTVVVTGASRGVGLALSRELLSRGHRVVAAARAPGRARGLQRLAAEYPETCLSSEIGSLAESTMRTGYGYCMSKTALNMFTVMFARSCPDMICVSLHPGWVKTDMGGAGATVEPEVSARGLADVLEGLRKTDSGKFIAYNGREIPW
ncbi:MAG: SDR family NAD(P)-dependent oxidoreductase [Kiritimatiellae bacterium]|nr:SDR family NAD(P)-dependent oxidoreductase [Kiritimatiellia bacterium]